MQKCNSCLMLKPLDDYHKNRKYYMCRNLICIECACFKSKMYYYKNLESIKKRKKSYYQENQLKFADYQRTYRNSKKEVHV